jgi:transposase
VPRISKPNEIKLRRAAALELTAKGYSQTEIAHRLNYHKSTISNDIRYLKEQAQKQFKQHVEQELPWQHKVAAQGLLFIKRQTISIAENAKDERIKLAALTLFKEVDTDLWNLHSSGEVLQEALEFVKQRKAKLKNLEQQKQYESGERVTAEGSEDTLAGDSNAIF